MKIAYPKPVKNTILLLGLVTLFSSCIKKPEARLSAQKQEVADQLDTYFTALTELQKFNGVIMAYKEDTLLLKKAYNLNSDPESSTFVTADSQFDIHSVSKLMARYLLLQLEEEEKLSIEDPVSQFYPSFPQGEKISLSMLLDHTSGLPREFADFEGDKQDLSREEIIQITLAQDLLFEPGTDSQYSNPAYEILYDIISRQYGNSFSQTLVNEIFDPLQMTNSGGHFFTDQEAPNQLAKNHVFKDSVQVRVPNLLKEDFKTSRIYSTAEDLRLFLKQLKTDSLARSMQNKLGIIAKDGGSDGIRAQVYLDTKNDFEFVLLANSDVIPFFKTIEDFAKMMRAEKVEIPKEINRVAIELTPAQMIPFEGDYSFADFGGLILTVKVEEGKLVVIQEGEVIAQMQAESESVFFEDPKAAESFEFIPNEQGSFDVLMGWKGITLKGVRQ